MYWLRDKDARFSTFLNIIYTYYHPEARNDAFDDLVKRARESKAEDFRIGVFKQELTRLLDGDSQGMPPGSVELAAEYDDFDNDDDFLVWLWRQLYPDEPVPGPQG